MVLYEVSGRGRWASPSEAPYVRRGRNTKAFVVVARLVSHLGGDGDGDGDGDGVVVMVEEEKRKGRVWRSVEK